MATVGVRFTIILIVCAIWAPATKAEPPQFSPTAAVRYVPRDWLPTVPMTPEQVALALVPLRARMTSPDAGMRIGAQNEWNTYQRIQTLVNSGEIEILAINREGVVFGHFEVTEGGRTTTVPAEGELDLVVRRRGTGEILVLESKGQRYDPWQLARYRSDPRVTGVVLVTHANPDSGEGAKILQTMAKMEAHHRFLGGPMTPPADLNRSLFFTNLHGEPGRRAFDSFIRGGECPVGHSFSTVVSDDALLEQYPHKRREGIRNQLPPVHTIEELGRRQPPENFPRGSPRQVVEWNRSVTNAATGQSLPVRVTCAVAWESSGNLSISYQIHALEPIAGLPTHLPFPLDAVETHGRLLGEFNRTYNPRTGSLSLKTAAVSHPGFALATVVNEHLRNHLLGGRTPNEIKVWLLEANHNRFNSTLESLANRGVPVEARVRQAAAQAPSLRGLYDSNAVTSIESKSLARSSDLRIVFGSGPPPPIRNPAVSLPALVPAAPVSVPASVPAALVALPAPRADGSPHTGPIPRAEWRTSILETARRATAAPPTPVRPSPSVLREFRTAARDIINFARNPRNATNLYFRIVGNPQGTTTPAVFGLTMVGIGQLYQQLGYAVARKHDLLQEDLARCEQKAVERLYREWSDRRDGFLTCFGKDEGQIKAYLLEQGEAGWDDYQADRQAAGLPPTERSEAELLQSGHAAERTLFHLAYVGWEGREAVEPLPSCRFITLEIPRGLGTRVLPAVDTLVDFSGHRLAQYDWGTQRFTARTRPEIEAGRPSRNWPDERAYAQRRTRLYESAHRTADCRTPDEKTCDFRMELLRRSDESLRRTQAECARGSIIEKDEEVFGECYQMLRSNLIIRPHPPQNQPLCPGQETERQEIMARLRSYFDGGFPRERGCDSILPEDRRALQVWCGRQIPPRTPASETAPRSLASAPPTH